MYLSFSSLYWLTGVMALVNGTLAGITRIITTETFDPECMLRMIEQYGVTFTLTAPSYLARLLHSPNIHTTNLSSLRYYLCGGSAVAPQLLHQVNKLLPVNICVAYGISEIGGMVSANLNFASKPNAVGLLKEGIEIRIVDDAGTKCGVGIDGEVCIRPPITFLGYWGDAAATEAAKDVDGWFYSGDVGHFDEDGFLQLVDRKKDILKYRNHQISPSELENLILECDGVSEVCVVGIPDDVSGELPVAVIVKVAGKEVSRSEIESLIEGNFVYM